MAVVTKPIAIEENELIALYRREEAYWSPHEMLEELIHNSPNMLAATAVRVFRLLERPRSSRAAVRKIAADVIREMVHRGHAADVEAYVKRMEESRCTVDRDALMAQVSASLDRLASRPDAPIVLEMVGLVVDALAGAVVLDAEKRDALIDGLRALAVHPATMIAVKKLEAALANKEAA